MDKFIEEIKQTATINELLFTINKKESRKRMDYFKYYIPFIIFMILIYVSFILLIIFVINKSILAFVTTFSVIYVLFVWGTFDKYFGLKIFRRIRSKEIEHFSK